MFDISIECLLTSKVCKITIAYIHKNLYKNINKLHLLDVSKFIRFIAIFNKINKIHKIYLLIKENCKPFKNILSLKYIVNSCCNIC